MLSRIVRSVLFLLLSLPSIASAQMLADPTITGAINFRDLGGIRTADGRQLRRGMIFRSGELSHLNGADFQLLAPLHITYVFDLRTDAERTAASTHWEGTQPTLVPISVGFPAGEAPSHSMQRIFANGTDPAHASEGMKAVTVRIALDGAPEIGTILHDLAAGDEPAIIHCTAGKDRTGVVTAILLRLLGMPEETIYADYLRSNDAVPAQMARLKAATAASGKAITPGLLASLPPASIQVLMGVDRSYLEAALAAIDARYGSFDNYVSQGLKLSAGDIQQLRGKLLDPAK